MTPIAKAKKIYKLNGGLSKATFFFTIYAILMLKIITLKDLNNDIIFGVYGLIITFYILSRFILAYFYVPARNINTKDYQSTVTFIIPAKNEEQIIAKTLTKCFEVNYPKDKIEVIAINDGSQDKTFQEMQKVKSKYPELIIVNWEKNKGKRYGMAEGIKRSKSEIIIFIDSDSIIKPEACKHLVKYFVDPEVAAVAGHGSVYNRNTNLLTKMQAVRYYVAFNVFKATESVFHSVTCCSGCISAYRREYVLEVLDKWLNQTFLKIKSTYGDDRSLTNHLLVKYKVLYSAEAEAETIVPENYRQFLKQQLRWKKSWIRESLRAATFMWKKNPIMALSFYFGCLLPLLAPIIIFRALIWRPIVLGMPPYIYLFGLFIMAFLYGVYFWIKRDNNLWFYGVMFSWMYTLILIWQLPYALLTIRDNRWGTR